MRFRTIAIVYALFWVSASATATTRYVSDVLYIPLKTKDENKGAVIKHLKSGTVVSVLEEGADGNFLKVQVQDGAKSIGWVKARYLVEEPIAKMELKRLRDTMSSLESKQGPLADTILKLKKQLAESKHQNAALMHQKKALEQKLDDIQKASADTLSIFRQNELLKKNEQQMTQRLKNIEKENETLSNNQRNEGIKLGLFAVVIGALAGFLLPYFKPRGRKQSGVRLR